MTIFTAFALFLGVSQVSFVYADTVSPSTCSAGVTVNAPIVSDASLISSTGSTIPASPIPGVWTSISGAAWVWGVDQSVAIPETESFTKTFALTATTSGTIEIAGDNQYSVTLNGHSIVSGVGYASTNSQAIDSSNFVVGSNTLVVSGTNDLLNGDNVVNPAGIIFKMNTSSCNNPTSLFGNGSSNNPNQNGSGLFGNGSSNNPNQNGSGLFGNDSSNNPNQNGSGLFGNDSSNNPNQNGSSTTPNITTTTDVSTTTDSSSGVVVTYTIPTATEASGPIPVICTPASGTNFPVGTTVVTCTATDAANNTSTTTFNVVVTQNPSPSNPQSIVLLGGGGGSFSSGGGSSASTTTLPAGVLPASCPLITTFMVTGGNNDASEVSKLQAFLNVTEGANVDVNGIYDQKTVDAVKAFQEKYRSDILSPWGAAVSSGRVYITTLKKINEISCNSPLTLSDAELAIINAYKNRSTTGAPSATVGQNAVTNTNASTSTSTIPEVGTNGTGNANTAAAANTSVFQRFWSFIKNIF